MQLKTFLKDNKHLTLCVFIIVILIIIIFYYFISIFILKLITFVFYIKVTDSEGLLFGSNAQGTWDISTLYFDFNVWYQTYAISFMTPARIANFLSFIMAINRAARFLVKNIPNQKKPVLPNNNRDDLHEDMKLRRKAEVEQSINIHKMYKNVLSKPEHPILKNASMADQNILNVIYESARPAILFKTVFPPIFPQKSFTFMGGLPIAPSEFLWPESIDDKGNKISLNFLGQVDCRTLPALNADTLLPDRGVLYFFTKTMVDTKDECAVIYHTGDRLGWSEIAPPANLPTYDEIYPGPYERTTLHEVKAKASNPRSIYPKWEMETGVVNDYQHSSDIQHLGEFGPELKLNKADEAQHENLILQLREQSYMQFHGAEIDASHALTKNIRNMRELWRPFSSFPQAWVAIETAVIPVLNDLIKSSAYYKECLTEENIHNISAEEIKFNNDQIIIHQEFIQQARLWLDKAQENGRHSPTSKLAKDTFWQWWGLLVTNPKLYIYNKYDRKQNTIPKLNSHMKTAALHSIDTCLSFSPDTARMIPQSVVEATAWRHHYFKKNAPNTHSACHKMLGSPDTIQGAGEEFGFDHIMLLQLEGDYVLDLNHAGCVYHFWIKPEDLAQRRFDRVIRTFECD